MDIENGKISMSGWLPSGRRVYFEQPSTGDLQRDISLAILMDKAMIDGGLAVREQGIEAGELTRDIRYLLRRKQKNDDGSFTPIIDLYAGNFRWVACWLNDDAQIAAFEQACGVELARMPISATPVKEYDPSDPDIANLFTVLGTPAQIVYKDNPRWHENLNEDDKKKISKRLFVRWLNVPATSPTMPPETRQAASTLGTGSQGRRLPVAAQNAGNAGNPSAGAMRVETLTEITAAHLKQDKIVFVTPDGALSFTREPFRNPALKLDTSNWTKPGHYDLGGACNVISVYKVPKRGKSFWEITKVERMGEAEAELFAPPPQIEGAF